VVLVTVSTVMARFDNISLFYRCW